MKNLLLWSTVLLALSSMGARSEDLPRTKSSLPERYSMVILNLNKSSAPSNLHKAACTGRNTCCCRAANQIFCTTPGECSRMGGACSAGC